MVAATSNITEILRCPLLVLDADLRVQRANPAFCRAFGVSTIETEGRLIDELEDGQWRIPPLRALLERLVADHGSCEDCQVEVECRQLGWRTMWLNAAWFSDEDGASQILLALEDVSATRDLREQTALRRLAEAQRDDLRQLLRAQIERMPVAYVQCGPDFRYTCWNRAAERLFGYSEAEVLGKHPFEVLAPPQSRPLMTSIFERLKAGDLHAHAVWDSVAKDGHTVTCEWHHTPLLDGDGSFQGVLSLASDLTEQKRLEERYRQAQKMEAIGQLAGGVAHDFNNLLTIITGYTELLLQRLPPGDPSHNLLKEIHGAGQRSASLTRQLLAFSRKQVVMPQPLDLNAVVANTEKLLQRVIGEDIQLRFILSPGLGTVHADPGQLEQVLMNLVVNARDAMPQGGKLTIETRNVELDESYLRIYPDLVVGPYALLAVSDTGCGMTAEVRNRIFEPFFTTKEAGQGTGLGLAVVHGIVRQAGGRVEVYSEPGVGTTFKVYLPLVNRPAQATQSQARLRVAPRGTETILLAEDEGGVRALSQHVLTECGYTVLQAADGIEALRIAEVQRGPIHLLVSDVVMPGLGGRQLAERVVALHPEAKVLHLSGYTDDAVVRHGVLHEEVHFLQKPFSPFALTQKVREVLDGA